MFCKFTQSCSLHCANAGIELRVKHGEYTANEFGYFPLIYLDLQKDSILDGDRRRDASRLEVCAASMVAVPRVVRSTCSECWETWPLDTWGKETHSS